MNNNVDKNRELVRKFNEKFTSEVSEETEDKKELTETAKPKKKAKKADKKVIAEKTQKNSMKMKDLLNEFGFVGIATQRPITKVKSLTGRPTDLTNEDMEPVHNCDCHKVHPMVSHEAYTMHEGDGTYAEVNESMKKIIDDLREAKDVDTLKEFVTVLKNALTYAETENEDE